MEKYKNKYRIPSARATWWDYGWNGAYFVTICTQDRRHYFGEVVDGNMVLSPLGAIADVLWHEIPHHFKHVELGDFTVMPNHVHGVLILDKPDGGGGVETLHATSQKVQGQALHVETLHVETLHATSLRGQEQEQGLGQETLHATSLRGRMAGISPKSESVPVIVRSYKAAVTKHARRLGLEMEWQPRFHDHIIRNDETYQRISDYIVTNASRWLEDKFFST